jgi:hypothetical protein
MNVDHGIHSYRKLVHVGEGLRTRPPIECGVERVVNLNAIPQFAAAESGWLGHASLTHPFGKRIRTNARVVGSLR